MTPEPSQDLLSIDALPPLTPVQEQLMADCYDLGPATARKIMAHHCATRNAQRDYRTVRYHLDQLVKKTYLTIVQQPASPEEPRKRHRPAGLYTPAIPREGFLVQQFQRFCELHLASFPEGPQILEKLLSELKERHEPPRDEGP